MSRHVNTISSLSAMRMRYVFWSLLVLIIAAMAGGFYIMYSSLSATAREIASLQGESRASDSIVNQLSQLKRQLADNQLSIERAKNIVAESQSYKYQDQIVNDITAYAQKSGVTITSISFSSAKKQTKGSTSLSVQLGKSTTYENLLGFLRRLERNLTKIRVASVSMARSEGKELNIQALDLEVYLK